MSGAGQNPMFGVRDKARSSLAALQCVVVLAVHDQRRAAAGRELGRQIRNSQRLEYLGNALRIEQAAALHEACQEIAPDGTIDPCLRHAVAEVREVIVFQRAGGVIGAIGSDAVIELRLRSAVAADKNGPLGISQDDRRRA